MRQFESGATRDDDQDKLDYEGFLHPSVIKRYAEYMHENRKQADGKLRDSDNWQKGIPIDAYMKSMWRHFMEVWTLHRKALGGSVSFHDQQRALCALMFNVHGYLFETLKKADARTEEMAEKIEDALASPKIVPAGWVVSVPYPGKYEVRGKLPRGLSQILGCKIICHADKLKAINEFRELSSDQVKAASVDYRPDLDINMCFIWRKSEQGEEFWSRLADLVRIGDWPKWGYCQQESGLALHGTPPQVLENIFKSKNLPHGTKIRAAEALLKVERDPELAARTRYRPEICPLGCFAVWNELPEGHDFWRRIESALEKEGRI